MDQTNAEITNSRISLVFSIFLGLAMKVGGFKLKKSVTGTFAP